MPTTFCTEDCDILAAPSFSSTCNPVRIEAGIRNIIIMSCNVRFAADGTIEVKDPTGSTVEVGLYTDTDSWQTLVDAGMISMTPEGKGSKDQPDAITQDLYSCRPETTVAHDHTLSFEFSEASTSGVSLGDVRPDISELLELASNAEKFRIGFVSCNTDYLFLNSQITDDPGIPGFEFSGVPYQVISDTSEDVQRVGWSPTFRVESGLITPFYMPGVYDIIKGATITT